MTTTIPTVDCRGMRCPAPILQIAKKARKAGREPLLFEVLADDDDFPKDLAAWCRTAKATLHELEQEGDVHRALVGLNGADRPALIDGTPRPAAAAPPVGYSPVPPPAPRIPAPQFAAVPQPAAPPPAPSAAVSAFAAPSSIPAPPPADASEVDLRGLAAPEPMLRLSGLLASHGGRRVRVLSDDPTFLTDVMGWAMAMRVTIARSQNDGATTMVELILPGTAATAPAAPTPLPLAAPVMPTTALAPASAAPAQALAAPIPSASTALAVAEDVTPRENLCSILVLRNDFESLMASLLVANGAAAQGMDVNVYFSFWGVNFLRGERPRADAPSGKVSWLQKMMKWMMPKGPRRQKMSKMHMAGAGKGMMEFFMKKNNVMTLPELLDSCVEQQVTFTVCTMSMGIMGVEKRDIMDLPNIEWGGVATFVETSKKASMSLVF
jgi:peroxiredoxin family protein/TusA-related sulfurtransferase